MNYTALKAENARYGQTMVEIPYGEWCHNVGPDTELTAKPTRVWRSRDFLCVQYELDPEPVRLSIQRTIPSNTRKGDFADGITWDDLQRIKSEIGYGDQCAMEIYPPDEHLVNVANIRHLWIVDAPDYMWTTQTVSRYA